MAGGTSTSKHPQYSHTGHGKKKSGHLQTSQEGSGETHLGLDVDSGCFGGHHLAGDRFVHRFGGHMGVAQN